MIWGFADIHNHQFAHLGFGGLALHGGAFGEVSTVPDHCNAVHGPGGSLDFVGQAMSSLAAGRPLIGHLVGGWPEFDGWPRWNSYTHQSVYEEWLLRAVEGGLRLMVMLAVNNEFLASIVNRAAGRTSDDMEGVDLQLMAAKGMESYIDAKSGGPGNGWYRIVTTPDEARTVMEAGKLAVVLGVEVDFLFGCHVEADLNLPALRERLDRYYDIGVRHLFPIHFADNGFGGVAFQNPLEYDPNFGAGTEVNPLSSVALSLYPVTTSDGTFYGYAARTGRCNVRGLTGLGMTLILEMISRGMIIDVDHMSARSRSDTLDLCEAVEYPVVSSHTGFVDIAIGDKRHEGQLTAREVERIRRLGGLVACIVNQGRLEQITTFAGPGQTPIPHANGGTSNTWLQAYRSHRSQEGAGPSLLEPISTA